MFASTAVLFILLFSSVYLSLPYNDHFSRWTWVSRYQSVYILDFVGAKGDASALVAVW